MSRLFSRGDGDVPASQPDGDWPDEQAESPVLGWSAPKRHASATEGKELDLIYARLEGLDTSDVHQRHEFNELVNCTDPPLDPVRVGDIEGRREARVQERKAVGVVHPEGITALSRAWPGAEIQQRLEYIRGWQEVQAAHNAALRPMYDELRAAEEAIEQRRMRLCDAYAAENAVKTADSLANLDPADAAL